MKLLAAGVLAGVTLQAALFATGFAPALVIAGSCLVLVAAVVGAFVVARRARGTTGAERRAWLCTAVGLGAWAIGCTLHLIDAIGGVERIPPRPADLFSGIATVLPAVSLIIGPGAPMAWNVRFRMILDGAMVAVALFVPAWPYLLGPANELVGPGGGAMGVAFPVVQIIALSVAIVLLSRSRSRAVTAYTVLAVAYGSLAVCALTYSAVTLYVHTWQLTAVSGFFLAATVVLAGVARHEMPAIDSPWLAVPTGVRAGLPYVPVVVAFVVAAAERLRGDTDDVLTAALFVLFALVLVRQFLALRGNTLLLAEVEQQREQLSYQATHDDLTGLSNRKHLHQQAGARLRTGEPVALLLIDLDHFKQVNDSKGHAAGDAVLVKVAQVLRAAVPAGHTVARLGGDEFAVFLRPAPPVDEARLIAERISAGVALIGARIGASIGVAYEPTGRATIGMLLSDADTALYQVKASGKGKVRLSPRTKVGIAGQAVQG